MKYIIGACVLCLLGALGAAVAIIKAGMYMDD